MEGSLATAMTAKTILLINNEPNVREILYLSLTDFCGLEVFSTGSLLEGLQRAIQDQPDAILLALSSCDSDYFIFLQKLRTQPETQTIPVVILTTGAKWIESKRVQRFQAVGVIDFAADPSLLSNQITKLLNLEAPLIGDDS